MPQVRWRSAASGEPGGSDEAGASAVIGRRLAGQQLHQFTGGLRMRRPQGDSGRAAGGEAQARRKLGDESDPGDGRPIRRAGMRGRDCHGGDPAVQCRHRPTAQEHDVSRPDGPMRPVFTTADARSADRSRLGIRIEDGGIRQPCLLEPLRDRIGLNGGASVAGASA